MKAIILAGGKGTRLYPVTLETPKPLITVRKKPIINYLIELFLTQGVEDIGISINADHKEDFRWWYERWWKGQPLQFFEETEPLGTFGGLVHARYFVDDDDFFVTNGDELKRLNLGAMREFHNRHPGEATIALVEHDRPQDYGVAEFEGKKIVRFHEKPENPPSQFISSGLYCFSPRVFDYYDFGGSQFAMLEKDLFPKLAEEEKLYGFPYQGKWYDCGTFERWQKAIEEWE